jgi:adenosine kinase
MGKRILVHGSIAIDYIMDFDDNLYNNCFMDPKTESFQMMVMPSTKKMQYGGTGANISYNIGLLGSECELITSVGRDFDAAGFKEHLKHFKNIILNLNVYPDDFCANCYIVNDAKKQQLIIYHGGATQKIPTKKLKDKGISNNTISWAINSPENPIQMYNVSKELSTLGINTILDTGQVTPAFNGDQLKEMIKLSKLVICNEHEFKMILEKTGLTEKTIFNYTDTVIVTQGAKGSEIKRKNEIIKIPIVTPEKVVDPTGAGDGYRSGLLCALHQGLSVEYGCKVGACVGSFVVETQGGQTQMYSKDQFKERFEKTFGPLDLKL